MVYIHERAGAPHVFTLTNGETLRVYAHEQTKPFSDGLISPEITRAARMGLVTIHEMSIAIDLSPVVDEQESEAEPADPTPVKQPKFKRTTKKEVHD